MHIAFQCVELGVCGNVPTGRTNALYASGRSRCPIQKNIVVVQTTIIGIYGSVVGDRIGDGPATWSGGAAQILRHPTLRAYLHSGIAVVVFISYGGCARTLQTATVRRSGEGVLIAVCPASAVLGGCAYIICGIGFQ